MHKFLQICAKLCNAGNPGGFFDHFSTFQQLITAVILQKTPENFGVFFGVFFWCFLTLFGHFFDKFVTFWEKKCPKKHQKSHEFPGGYTVLQRAICKKGDFLGVEIPEIPEIPENSRNFPPGIPGDSRNFPPKIINF